MNYWDKGNRKKMVKGIENIFKKIVKANYLNLKKELPIMHSEYIKLARLEK